MRSLVCRSRSAWNVSTDTGVENDPIQVQGGYGYSTVRASPDELVTEFVCIPPPLERSESEDGGPLRYRVIHRVARWAPGERPEMRQEIVEGDVGLSI